MPEETGRIQMVIIAMSPSIQAQPVAGRGHGLVTFFPGEAPEASEDRLIRLLPAKTHMIVMGG
jgi:hypothetical protein